MSDFLYNIPAEKKVYCGFIAFILCCAAVAIHFQSMIPFLFPFSVLAFTFIIEDYRRLFYLIFLLLPFSVEFYFEGPGLGTDLPTEPLMITLAFITLVIMIRNKFSFYKYYITHPIFILLGIHLFWLIITSIHSTHHLISIKFLLAKMWYVLPFFYLPLIFVKNPEEFEKTYRILYKFLFVVICVIIVRHAFLGFNFASVNQVVTPFFRNHVTYAAISVICLPFVWAFYRINILESKPNHLMRFIFIVFIVGIFFSYTRAAILSMVIAMGAWYIIQRRWVRQALFISSTVAICGITYLSWNNKYMELTPTFERTIAHTEFDNLLEATYKLEDISSMERLFRWMAGVEMIKEKFWLGFGPGTFYSNYKSYSISRFQTYVSDNPDHSGIHNYFLMTWVEQGFIGFMVFITLCILLLVEAEKQYHLEKSMRDKILIMATTLCLIIIFAMCLINDLIETDKVGPFFFLNTAIILFYSHKNRNVTNHE
jgi:O-antigen ligase